VTTTTGPSVEDRRRAAIRRSQTAARARYKALVAEVDTAIGEVGWSQARPCVVTVLGEHVPVSGPHGRWRGLLRVRTARRLLDMLDTLPAQPHLPFGDTPTSPASLRARAHRNEESICDQ